MPLGIKFKIMKAPYVIHNLDITHIANVPPTNTGKFPLAIHTKIGSDTIALKLCSEEWQ